MIGCEGRAPFLYTEKKFFTIPDLIDESNPAYMLCSIHFNIISVVHKILHAWDWCLFSGAPNAKFRNVWWFLKVDEVKYLGSFSLVCLPLLSASLVAS